MIKKTLAFLLWLIILVCVAIMLFLHIIINSLSLLSEYVVTVMAEWVDRLEKYVEKQKC